MKRDTLIPFKLSFADRAGLQQIAEAVQAKTCLVDNPPALKYLV